MTQDDFPEFSALVSDMAGCYPQQVALNAGRLAMLFRALASYSLAEVRAAMDAHLKHPTDCKFFPMPGQLIAHIRAAADNDGRPGPEEAWALALTCRDEADTVVWTPEIAQAWGVARLIYAEGDEIGARMAFKEVYARRLSEARAVRRPVEWVVAEGHDASRRAQAVRLAVDAGRAPGNASEFLALPAPRGAVALLLGMDAASGVEEARAAALERLQAGVRRISEAGDAPSPDAIERQRTNELRQQTAERVAAYAGGAA